MSIEELLSKLPVFARPELSTFVPYDINSLTSEMVLEKQRDEQHKKIRIITAISLSFIAVITICVLAFFVNYTKKQRKFAKNPPVSSRNLANRPLPPAPIYHPRNF
ncbi:unnamed protein product [Caenorhabditis angaria]|uniref:Uncharacterized protein n=1 Tax=Caenorhabditis angaria TaxID=860376 RepID=A0A9P1I883_9PELO|nr:unnamed protein product [Caenorhabditis angaria]